MKLFIAFLLMLTAATGTQAIPSHYYGEINGSGNYRGALDINFGWIDAPFGLNSWGEHVNLWGFNASAGDRISFDIYSDSLTSGFSFYLGAVDSMDLLTGFFNNAGDIGNATFLTGSTPWDNSQNLNDFFINQTGFYTLIIGGKDFGGYEGYTYGFNVSQVPEPASILLLMSGLLGLCVLRVRQNAKTRR